MKREDFLRILVIFSPHSTRVKEYLKKTRQEISQIAREKNLKIQEIALDNLPYFTAREKIMREIRNRDLVVAAGGDGITQVAFDALNFSQKNAIFAVIPLGHGNDLAHALNFREKSPQKILQQKIIDFSPLEITFYFQENSAKNSEKIAQKNQEKIFLASYVTFGATTILTDFLNQENQRKIRQKSKFFSPAFSVKPKNFREISTRISKEKFPDFLINSRKISDDSVGFFLVSAAKNLLRVPKKILFSQNEFFFHCAKMHDKNLLQKIVSAGIWVTKFPGEIAREKTLRFLSLENFAVNIAGDNVFFENVYKISAKRSERKIRIFAKKDF